MLYENRFTSKAKVAFGPRVYEAKLRPIYLPIIAGPNRDRQFGHVDKVSADHHGPEPRWKKTKTPRVIGRLCAICGKRGGNTEGFNTFLMRNAIPGEKAHPRCVREYGEAHARLFELRCRSKRGEYLSPDDMRFLMDCNKKWPLAYGALGKAVFAETAPFGSRL